MIFGELNSWGEVLRMKCSVCFRKSIWKCKGRKSVVKYFSPIIFILAGKTLWGLGLAASCFSIAGHYVGAGMVVNNDVKIIKPIILIVLVLLLIKMVSGI